MSDPRALVLVTRPQEAAARLVQALEGIRAEFLVSPILELRPVPFTPPPADAKLILTSAYGVVAASQGMDLAGREAACVGEATARAMTEAGARVDLVAETSAALVENIRRARSSGPMVHLRGEHALGLADRLNSAGIETEEVICYAQDARPLSPRAQAKLKADNPVILPVFSPRSAALMAAQIAGAGRLHVVAISEAAAAPLRNLADECTIAERPDMASMVTAIRKAVSAL